MSWVSGSFDSFAMGQEPGSLLLPQICPWSEPCRLSVLPEPLAQSCPRTVARCPMPSPVLTGTCLHLYGRCKVRGPSTSKLGRAWGAELSSPLRSFGGLFGFVFWGQDHILVACKSRLASYSFRSSCLNLLSVWKITAFSCHTQFSPQFCLLTPPVGSHCLASVVKQPLGSGVCGCG